jgi:NhaP-type Na+/H+ or K+/H+ antiporter
VLAEPLVRRLPLSPAVLYLGTGWAAGTALGGPSIADLVAQAPVLVVATELAVLVSLFAVGLRLGVPVRWRSWRAAVVLAGPGMVAMIGGCTLAGFLLLDLPWALALLLAAVLAPTDPVLASEVQIRSPADRDAVRLTITAEGGLNDGTALPAVLAALALLGLHRPGEGAPSETAAGLAAAVGVPAYGAWLWHDVVWPIGGGALLCLGLGRLLGRVLRVAIERGHAVRRDEWLYAGAVLLGFGLARATGASAFVVVFIAGVGLLNRPGRSQPVPVGARGDPAQGALGVRLCDFGERIERLVEACMVLGVGVTLHGVAFGPGTLALAAVVVLVVRPLTASAVMVGPIAPGMSSRQRRLVAWFGIRGIGSLYYAAYAMDRGIAGPAAGVLLSAVLTTIALSVVVHGVSATPLMLAYQRHRGRPDPPAPG